MTYDRHRNPRPAVLDLAEYEGNINRLIANHASFRAAVKGGHDADDLRQEVWVTLLSRQQGKGRSATGRGAYDPARGSLATWVGAVCRSAVHHYLERGLYRDEHERVDSAEEPELTAEAQAAKDVGDDEHKAIVPFMMAVPHNEIAAFLLAGNSIQQARKAFPPAWHAEVVRVANVIRRQLEAVGTTRENPTDANGIPPSRVTKRDNRCVTRTGGRGGRRG